LGLNKPKGWKGFFYFSFFPPYFILFLYLLFKFILKNKKNLLYFKTFILKGCQWCRCWSLDSAARGHHHHR